MSYLPHESKTYKEPEEPEIPEPRELTFQNLPPASSLVNENASSPEMILKHYSYTPHPPPLLPGPSVFEDVQMTERLAASRKKRSEEAQSKLALGAESSITQKFVSIDTLPEPSSSTITPRELDKGESSTSRKSKGSKSTVGKKKTSKKGDGKKKDPPDKPDEFSINFCMISDDATRFLSESKKFTKSRENSICKNSSKLSKTSSDLKLKSRKVATKKSRHGTPLISEDYIEVMDQSIQCEPAEEGILKITIIPTIINSLFQAVTLLIEELKEESPAEADIITNLENLALSLTNYKVEDDFCFEVSYADAKKLEDIFKDVFKYIDEAYVSDQGKCAKRKAVKKKLFGTLFERDYELELLTEKIKSIRNEEDDFIDYSCEKPELELQNKILENEQLRAKIEFNYMEFKRFHKALAENDWEIKCYQEEVHALKKLLAKAENLETTTKISAPEKTKDKKKQLK